MSPPVHLLVLLDFKQIDKNPGGVNDSAKRKRKEKRDKRKKHEEKEQNL